MEEIAINETDWQEQADDFAEFLTGLCAPPSDEPTEVFAEQHVILQDGPFAGSYWRLQFTPLARFILAAIRRAGVRRVVIMISAQYLKTITLIISFLRNAKEDPADTMWVMAEADQIAEFMEKRLLPYIESCDVVAPLFKGRSKGLVKFESFNLLVRGAGSRAKLQSDPIRRVYCDERREWKRGSIDLLRKRMRTFPNAQEISAGVAGSEFDELHIDYLEGTQTRAHIGCLKCGHSQPIRFGREVTSIWKTEREFGGFRWNTNDTTCPGGKWDYEEVAKTVIFECENPACRHHYKNSDKYDLLRTMHTHDYNPKAPADKVSFGGSAFEAIWESCDWDKLVIEFLKAIEEAKRGNVEPLKAFVTETLGEPWQDRLGVITNAGFLETRKADYDFGDVWAEAKRRFISADVQERGGEHYPYVVREFGLLGASRLVVHGTARTLEELQQIRLAYGIGPTSALIDSGYNSQKIYRFCIACNWKPFKGEAREYYLVPKPHPKNPQVRVTVRQLWHKSVAVAYNEQTRQKIGDLPLYLFCNEATNDLLAEYQTGLIGNWTIPAKCDNDYIQQMVGDVRKEKEDNRGGVTYYWHTVGPNHKRDCERMILTAAIIVNLVNAPIPPPPKPLNPKAEKKPAMVNVPPSVNG